jgi:FKBP-type peptidyl-prolyl cis-trans isomerase
MLGMNPDFFYTPKMEPGMRRFFFVLTILLLVPVVVVYSQDPLPPAGQPSQPQQQPRTQNQPAIRAFGNQGNAGQGAAPGGAGDAAYMQQVSYALGRNFAMELRDNEIQVDANFLMAGISDVMRGAQPKWSEQQLEATLDRFRNEMQQKMMARMQQQATKNHQAAEAFLAQNGKVAGVQTTPSGLQYRVLRQGQPNGPAPTLGDQVRCNYKGTLLNGNEFDSSAKNGRPAEFSVSDVIPGWTEALQKMHVGDKWQLFIPPKLAYDMRPPRGAPIEPGSLLVFEIELLDVVRK